MIQMPFVKRLLLGLFAVLLLEVVAAPAVGASGPVRAKLEIPRQVPSRESAAST